VRVGVAHLVDAWVCVDAMTRVCEEARVWVGAGQRQEGRASDQTKKMLCRWILV